MLKKTVSTKKNNNSKTSNNVLWLGLTSLFSDISSEMLTPILPLFLFNVLGASGMIIGLVEGLAKASEHLLSIFSGWASDRLRKRKSITLAGYFIATLMKGAYAFAFTWPQLLIARVIERSGKAIRNPPRDALLAESISTSQKRWGFSLHRVLDTLGAIIGPFVTIAFLFIIGVNIKTLVETPNLLASVSRDIFLLALIPGFIGVAIIAFLVVEPDKKKEKISNSEKKLEMQGFFAVLKDIFNISKYGDRYKAFLIASLILYIAIPATAFIYLRASEIGFDIIGVLLVAAMYNITYIFGASLIRFIKLRDERLLAIIMVLLALTFFGFVFANGIYFVIPFAAFGFIFGMFEVAMPTYISAIVPSRVLAGAFGTYNTFIGLAILTSGILLGAFWDVNPTYTFIAAGILSLAAFAYFVKHN